MRRLSSERELLCPAIITRAIISRHIVKSANAMLVDSAEKH